VQASPDVRQREHQMLKRTVEAANERFHDSLDELEVEIRTAQAVLRRDIALIKADRKKREAAVKEKEAEKARQAAESSARQPTPLPKEAPTEAPKELKREQSPAAPSPTKPEAYAPAPIPASVSKPPTPPAEPTELKREMEDKAPAPAPATAEPPPSAPPAPSSDNDAKMENVEDLGDTNGGDDFDFDALFNDAVMDTGDDQDVKMDDGPDLDFTLDEPAPSQLLAGLEDFAKGSDDDQGGQSNNNNNNNGNADVDITMTDLPEMAKPQSSENKTKPAEESFDLPPNPIDDLNLETMGNDNIDDLFDLDYENPEATQFDDAFFGFGES
jgi:hypothetical protein